MTTTGENWMTVDTRGSLVPLPYESLQHPLSVYDSLLEVA
jgi:hypothetical protein